MRPVLLLPLAATFALTALIGAVLLFLLVARMDREANAQVRAMLAGAIKTRGQALAGNTRDYGRWDDAVVNLYGDLDRGWASTNLAMASDIFAFDQDRQTLFSIGPDGSEAMDPARRPRQLARAAAATGEMRTPRLPFGVRRIYLEPVPWRPRGQVPTQASA